MSARPPPRRVGVLGGMGPAATLLFMQRVLALTPARRDADHIPLIIDNNTQVPSGIAALIEGTGDDPAASLVAMARKLEAYGARALAMPSNTAHAHTGAINEAVSIPLLNMVDLSAEVAGKISRSARVGVLASPATRLAKIFDGPMEAAGLIHMWPRDDARVLDALIALKQHPRDKAARTTATRIVQELAASGAGAVLIASTEFSLIAEEIGADIPLIDTLDVLAAATVAFAQSP